MYILLPAFLSVCLLILLCCFSLKDENMQCTDRCVTPNKFFSMINCFMVYQLKETLCACVHVGVRKLTQHFLLLPILFLCLYGSNDGACIDPKNLTVCYNFWFSMITGLLEIYLCGLPTNVFTLWYLVQRA